MSREIDRQIAELMGWKLRHDFTEWVTPDENYNVLPEFSTDWNAMRLLVERLNKRGITACYDIELTTTLVELVNDERMVVTQFEADTAPLALCKAVLSLPKGVLI